MCGILGYSCPPGGEWALSGAIDVLKARGPDASGMWHNSNRTCVIAHTRLAIFDLSDAGAQPMADSTGRYVISFNGEIYNWRALRVDLERRHGLICWRSQSDTEVLVEGYAREGIAFIDKLNGVFAFALYDSLRDCLVVARDPMGVKPLFFTEQKGAFFFASEPQALLSLPELSFSWRREAFAEIMAFTYVPEPFTAFSEISRVPPGEVWTIQDGKRAGRVALFRWLDGPALKGDETELDGECERLLTDAVRRQCAADVPLAVMLSGGLDSSLITALAAQSGARLTKAFTIAPTAVDSAADSQGDELVAARLVASMYSLELTAITPASDMLDALGANAAPLCEGISDPAAAATRVIARGARDNGVKVLLSGQGADELFSGYRRSVAESFIRAIPAVARRAVATAGLALPSQITGAFNAPLRRARRFAELSGLSDDDRLVAMYTWGDAQLIASLFTVSPGAGWRDRFLETARPFSTGSPVKLFAALDTPYSLLPLNLAYSDRMTMAEGVEGRVPFLDLEFVKFAYALPDHFKLARGVGKSVLRRIASRYLPRAVTHRSKAGFTLPIRAWTTSLRDIERLRSLTRVDSASPAVFKPDALDRLLAARRERGADVAQLIYSMISIVSMTTAFPNVREQ